MHMLDAPLIMNGLVEERQQKNEAQESTATSTMATKIEINGALRGRQERCKRCSRWINLEKRKSLSPVWGGRGWA
jgi:hypothetical protein